jgi:hypothetical protein
MFQELPPGTARLLRAAPEALPALDLRSASTHRRRTRDCPLVAHSLDRHAPQLCQSSQPAP